MKNLAAVIILVLIVFAGIAYAAVQNIQNIKNSEAKGGIMDGKKLLVAYFSWGGNTKYIAEKIAQKTNADIFRIETKIPYPSDYNETAYGIAKEQNEKGIKPELKDNGDTSNYDIIFVGTPAWWYTMAPAVKTFLSENKFEGKVIVPFITHGGGGKYNIADDMKNISKASDVLTPFVVYGRGDSNTDKEMDIWLNELKY